MRTPIHAVTTLAFLALAALGCSDDDGLSPYRPAAGIAGTWVREQGPVWPSTDIAFAWHDTIQLAANGSGRWSYEPFPATTGSPSRVVADVMLDVELPFLFLDYLPCAACEQSFVPADRAAIPAPPLAPRRESRIAGPAYRIVRDGVDRFALVTLFDPAAPRQYFYRATDTSMPY